MIEPAESSGKAPATSTSQPDPSSVSALLALRSQLHSIGSARTAGGLAEFISSLRPDQDADSAEILDFVAALKGIGDQRSTSTKPSSNQRPPIAPDGDSTHPTRLVTSANETWENWGIIDDVNTFATGELFTRKMFRPTTASELSSAILQAESEQTTIRALGSGWSFSDAVLPQSAPTNLAEFVMETLDKFFGTPYAPLFDSYGYAIDTSELTANLQDLLPGIVAEGVKCNNLFFNEAGITIDALNDRLNQQSPPLAMPTLGGSGGQTIAGAISTGTHGADFDRAPIADAVRAMYVVAAEGSHHWIEPKSHQFTDPSKIHATFPDIAMDNIHYDDDLFHAAIVSMGSMGAIYALVLGVVPQYALIQFNLWSTWENLQEIGGAELSRVAHGAAFPELASFLDSLYPRGSEPFPYSRALQVVVNPIKNDDGTHNCYATIRFELPMEWLPEGMTLPAGVVPGNLGTLTLADMKNAIESSPDFGFPQKVAFAFANISGDTLPEQAQSLINFCKSYNYYWAVRAVIDMIMQKTFPQYTLDGQPPNPQIDLGYKVMTGNVYGTVTFGLLGVTSIEPAFPFKDAINYVNSALAQFDQGIPNNIFPAGYLSLRASGPTSALLGMQQFGELPTDQRDTDEFPNVTGSVEVSLLGNGDDFGVIESLERMALTQGGILHWGQSNGLMNGLDVQERFQPAITKWKAARQQLDTKGTFTNLFMQRCNLV
jgi:hypothetical protein